MKAVRIAATFTLAGVLALPAGAAHAAPAGGEAPAGQERAVVVLPGAGQLPTAVWLPVPHRAADGPRPAAPADPGDHFTKASARTPVPGLSGGSLASLTAGSLTAAAASLLVATRRLRSRRR